MVKESYSESEAAGEVGITVARLHQLLDRYVFTGPNRRPHAVEFTSSDLLLLSYWKSCGESDSENESKVIAMPIRK
jgi:hypothetical protein